MVSHKKGDKIDFLQSTYAKIVSPYIRISTVTLHLKAFIFPLQQKKNWSDWINSHLVHLKQQFYAFQEGFKMKLSFIGHTILV